jgi:ribonuclease HI
MKLFINTDGGARGNPGPAGIGVVIGDESGKVIGHYKQYIGEATNNVAEYKALLLGLSEAAKLGGEELEIKMDSELIVRQMTGQYKIKEPTLKLLATDALKLLGKFKNAAFRHVPREQNKEADRLVNQALDEAALPKL